MSGKEQYIHDIKYIFPLRDNKVKKFIRQFSESIEESANETMAYDDYVEQFGSPNEVVASFYHESDSDYLYHQMNLKKVVYFSLGTLAVLLILIGTKFQDMKWDYKVYYNDNIIPHIYINQEE